MLTHRWKKLGLPDPVSPDGTDQTSERSRSKKQLAMKTDSLLKMHCPIQASHDGAPRENEQADGLQGSRVRISEGKINDKPGSECPSDSTLSDQEQESIETSKWAAAMKLKPESFAEDHLDHHSTGTAVYPDVLPSALPHSTQQSVDMTDPCLASLITRLIELEGLQAATVQKEKAKLARSRPATANTRCGHRLKKRDFPGCNARIPRDAECHSVMCSFTKLAVCPSSSCKYRHHTCSTTKPGRGTKTKSPHPNSPDGPDSMSSKSNTAETVLPIFSVHVKVPQKPTMPNRTKSSKTHGGSISERKATVPNKKS